MLARTEEDAQQIVLAWQSRCYPIPATVREVRPGGEDYRDSPAVVWQGYRDGAAEG